MPRRPPSPSADALRGVLVPTLAAAAGAAIYLLVAPPSADLAAQEYRADLGLTLWNNGWFAGHHTPGYSVLFPPLGGALGVRLTGALAAVAAGALFAPLARAQWGARAGGFAALWFALGTTALLLTGRITFLLGIALGTGALLALAGAPRGAGPGPGSGDHRGSQHATRPAPGRSRPLLAALLALATTLASPVAGLFVALAATAWALADLAPRRRTGTAIVAAALAPVAVTLVLFPQGGSEPFVASAFWPALAGTAIVGALLPRQERTLRIGALIYALALVAAFALDTPLGGNATRLGALLAGPIALGALSGRRHPALVALLAAAFAYWPVYPAVRDVVRASGDPSLHAGYYAPLVDYLRAQGTPGSFRIEIPFTENHWEARHVAPTIPLARGWERQLDRRFGALFYDGSLTAKTYRAWLDARAVAFVAVPDVPLDHAGADEAKLVRAGLPYLREVWHGAHWRVFAVSGARPLADGAGATATLSSTGVVVRAARPGTVRLRVHATRWWRVTAGRACVRGGPGDTTLVRVDAAGTIRLRARLTGSACEPG